MSTTEYILLLAGGATGTEVVRWLLNFRRDRRQDERQGEQVEFQHFTDLNKQATELRDEMRRNNTELRTELNQLRGEVENWRRSYFDLFHTAREIQQSSGGRDKLMFTGDGPAPASRSQHWTNRGVNACAFWLPPHPQGQRNSSIPTLFFNGSCTKPLFSAVQCGANHALPESMLLYSL